MWFIIALLFIMLFLNFPIMIVLLVSALLMMLFFAPNIDYVIFVQQLSSSIESYVLLAIPMFAHLPKNSVLVYGQPNEGMVLTRINSAIQNMAKDLLTRFYQKE